MSKGKVKPPTQRQFLVGSLIIGVVAVIISAILFRVRPGGQGGPGIELPVFGQPSKTLEPPTNPSDLPPTVTTPPPPEPTPTILTPTPVNYPTPSGEIVKLNLPEGFEVVHWESDYVECDRNKQHMTFNITGVIIPLGHQGHQFAFNF